MPNTVLLDSDQEFKFYRSRTILIVGVIFPAFIFWLVAIGLFMADSFGPLGRSILVVVFGGASFLLWWGCHEIFSRKPLLILNKKGLIFRRKMILWSDVEDITGRIPWDPMTPPAYIDIRLDTGHMVTFSTFWFSIDFYKVIEILRNYQHGMLFQKKEKL